MPRVVARLVRSARRRRAARPAAPATLLVALVAACGGGPAIDEPSGPASGPATIDGLRLTPDRPAAGPGERICLAVADDRGRAVPPGTVAWTVRDAEGPHPGGVPPADAPPAVSADGCLVAPATGVPWTRELVVRASRAQAVGAGEATVATTVRVLLVPARTPPGAAWTLWEPRVVDAANPGTVFVTVVSDRELTAATLQPTDAGGSGSVTAPVAFTRYGARVWRVALDGARLVRGHRTGAVHHPVGRIELTDARGTTRSVAAVGVRDAAMPAVPATRPDDRAQWSAHVLNLREDDVLPWHPTPPAIVRRLYAAFPDAYDFVTVVDQVQQARNRFFHLLRNDVAGIGLDRVEQGAAYGSAARLQGIVRFPIDAFYDAGGRAMAHELGHRWIAWLRVPALRGLGGHWPVGEAAYGVMGFGMPPEGQGGDFPFTFAPGDDGGWTLRLVPVPQVYTALELYLMGLAPASEVAPLLTFVDQAQFGALAPGQRVHGAAAMVTIADVIAAEGARVPAHGAAPTGFRVATIVLSAGRLLTPGELAFFDHVAARGAATTELPHALGTTLPFHLATRRRGTLDMRLGAPR